MRKVYSLLRKCVKWRAAPLIFMAVQSNAFAAAQDSSNVSLNFTNQPIENVFIALEKQTGYTVFFSGSTLDGNSRVSVNVSQVSLSNALAAVLHGRNITWTIKHKGIVLSKKPAAPATPASQPVNAAVRDTVPLIDVAGVVVDPKGNPIPAATVSIKGSSRGQGTDNLGRFSFTKVPGNATLVFSSLGYDPKQVKIGGRNEIRVALDSAIREIEGVEVFSTGYQDVPKERATGSFVQLNEKLIARTPYANILDRINYVTNSLRYDPTNIAGTQYIIRGFSTINADKKPLIIIDGFPYEETGDNLVERLNPNDVKSITILKDAASASIWGARSGNGVIVITTKKGNFNTQNTIHFTTNLTLTQKLPIHRIPTISSADAISYERKIFESGYYNDYDDLYPSMNLYPILSPAMEVMLAGRRNTLTKSQVDEKLNQYANHDIRDDLNKYFIRNPFTQQYNLNLSGGGNKYNYFTSLGYDNNAGGAVGSNSERYTFNFTNEYRLHKVLELSSYINYSKNISEDKILSYSNILPMSGYLNYNKVAPYSVLADSEGKALDIPNSGGYRDAYIDTINTPGLMDWHYNPLAELNNGKVESKTDNVRVGGNIRFNILPSLKLNIKGQYQKANSKRIIYTSDMAYSNRNQVNKFMYIDQNGEAQYPYPQGGNLTTTNTEETTWNLRTQLNYNKKWNRNDIAGMAGIESSENNRSGQTASLYGYNSSTLTFNNNLDFKTPFPTRPSGYFEPLFYVGGYTGNIKRFRSYFANATYVYDNKYTLFGSARIDEANMLGIDANLRKVPLWSIGGAWNMTNENFLLSNFINHLNLRVSYGWNGNINNSISQLATIRYATWNTSYTSLPYARIQSPPNPDLTWEKVKTLNIGLDFKLLQNRLSGTLEYYQKNGEDLIGLIPSDPTKGIGLFYTTNYASIATKGMDIQLNATALKLQNINWNILTNISFNKETVTEYKTLIENAENNAINYLNPMFVFKGRPLFQIYSYKWAGLDPLTGDPRGFSADTIASYSQITNNLELKPDDLVHAGSLFPRITGNMLNSLAIKNFIISFNISYKFKYYFRRQSINYSNLINYWVDHSDYSKRWKIKGDEMYTNIPSEILSPNEQRDNFYSLSSILVEKADHIRLQDVRIDYSIPIRNSKKSSISTLSFNAMISNIGIIWRANRYGIDPDSPLMPIQKTFTLGVGLKI